MNLGGGDPEHRGRQTYHFERSEGQEGVAALTVGPRVPARVLTLLQDELLTCEATLAVANPAEAGEGGKDQRIRLSSESHPAGILLTVPTR